MDYIFLDIDGVLNYPGDQDLIEDTISKARLEQLVTLVEELNAHVVIISSRRSYKDDRDQLLRIMDDLYYHISFLSDKPLARYRADEIEMYINNYSIESYIILDDVDCNYSTKPWMAKYFIEVKQGFTQKEHQKAIELLENRA